MGHLRWIFVNQQGLTVSVKPGLSQSILDELKASSQVVPLAEGEEVFMLETPNNDGWRDPEVVCEVGNVVYLHCRKPRLKALRN